MQVKVKQRAEALKRNSSKTSAKRRASAAKVTPYMDWRSARLLSLDNSAIMLQPSPKKP